jgi:hypothetical protein
VLRRNLSLDRLKGLIDVCRGYVAAIVCINLNAVYRSARNETIRNDSSAFVCPVDLPEAVNILIGRGRIPTGTDGNEIDLIGIGLGAGLRKRHCQTQAKYHSAGQSALHGAVRYRDLFLLITRQELQTLIQDSTLFPGHTTSSRVAQG